MKWQTIDARVRLLGALLALIAGYDIYVLPVALAPTAPEELTAMAQLAWWALCVISAWTVLRCAVGAAASRRRVLAPSPVLGRPVHPVVARRRD